MNDHLIRDRARSIGKSLIPSRNARRLTVLLAVTWWGSVLLMFGLRFTEGVPESVGTELSWTAWLASQLNVATGTSEIFVASSVPFVVLIISRASPVKRIYESLLATYIITTPIMVADSTTAAVHYVEETPAEYPSGYVMSQFVSGFSEPLGLMFYVITWMIPFGVGWWALKRYNPGYLKLGGNVETETRGGTHGE